MVARSLPPHLARKYSKQRNITWRQAVEHAPDSGQPVVIDVMAGEDAQLRPLLSKDDANAVVCGLYNARRVLLATRRRPGIAKPAVRLTWLFTAVPARP